MKKRYLPQLLLVLFTMLLSGIKAQTFEIRIVENGYGYLEVQMRETSGTGTPTKSTPISLVNFQIRWLSSLGADVAVICTSNPYNIADGLGAIQTTGSYNWRTFYASSTPFNCPTNWVTNQWEPITIFKVTTGSGTGTFEVAPDGWVAQGCNWGQGSPAIIYHPTVNGSADNYIFPTLEYDRIWNGNNTDRWNLSGNWSNSCGLTSAGIPTTSLNVFVPNINEDTAYNPTTATLDLSCKALTIGPGGWLTVPATKKINATGPTVVRADGVLDILASTTTNDFTSIELKPSVARAASAMTIYPGAKVTASGTTTLTSASQLKILASSTAAGSFLDNGTIVQTTGTADVQTYIKNTAASGSYYAHLVGPTVSDQAFQTANGFPGVYLSAFNLGVNTYAHEYTEAINDWTNIYLNTTPVRSTKGIMISTVDATNHTMTMTGKLVAGTLSSAALQHGTNNLDLLSNPYPSTLDFDIFQPANSGVITNKYYVYNPGTGTYSSYQIGVGGALNKNIPLGQGFFVETLSTGTVTFTNSQRIHSTAFILKDIYPYQLRLNLAGNGYADATFINFSESGSWGYDVTNDTYKWMSMLPEASEIWTVANDQSLLCMNSLPELGNNMVNVPLNFKCSAEGPHNITAENIGSFDVGTEIFLEDLEIGGEWHDLVQYPVYEFIGTPDGDQNRFIVHFFGPTGIDDPHAARLIKIYGYGQDAYIVNRGTETIKEYIAYDMMGRVLHRGTLPNNTVNKVTVGDASAYYVVKVITKEGRVYTDKVYITK